MSRDDLNYMTGKQSSSPSNYAANGRVVPATGQPGNGQFTASLRRQRVPPGRLEDGSQTGSQEPVTAALASVQNEITVLQQITETLRELAHTQKATNHRLSNATDPVQRYTGPPGRPADGGLLSAEPLTRTEEAVLRRLTTTLSLLEIGRERNVSRDTIKGQVRSIYRKLGVSDRHEAVQRGRELDLLTRRKKKGPVSLSAGPAVPAVCPIGWLVKDCHGIHHGQPGKHACLGRRACGLSPR